MVKKKEGYTINDVTHEMNNVLHVINAKLTAIKSKSKDNEELTAHTKVISEQVVIASQLMNKLENLHYFNALYEEASADGSVTPGMPITTLVPAEARNNESVLLVDDDNMALTIAIKRLRTLNYRVTPCKSPEEALEVMKNRDEEFDFGLIDQRMPNMSGIELAKKLNKIQPGLPIILCTGQKVEMTDEARREVGIVEIMRKPVLIHKIAEAMRAVLDDN